jgi:hypothetical protein
VEKLETTRARIEIFGDDSANVMLKWIGWLVNSRDKHFEKESPLIIAEE